MSKAPIQYINITIIKTIAGGLLLDLLLTSRALKLTEALVSLLLGLLLGWATAGATTSFGVRISLLLGLSLGILLERFTKARWVYCSSYCWSYHNFRGTDIKISRALISRFLRLSLRILLELLLELGLPYTLELSYHDFRSTEINIFRATIYRGYCVSYRWMYLTFKSSNTTNRSITRVYR